MFVIGAAFGTAVTPQIQLVMKTSPAPALGQASAMFNTFRQMGTAFGVAFLGALHISLGLSGTSILAAILLLIAFFLVWNAQRIAKLSTS